MSLKYTLVQKIDPEHPDKPMKWYAEIVSPGEISFEMLIQMVSKKTGIAYETVKESLQFYMDEAERQMKDGMTIVNNFGTFYFNLRDSGKRTEFVFIPGAALKKMLANIKLERV
jgi:hypothetical protein